jgi:hypothetical protein
VVVVVVLVVVVVVVVVVMMMMKKKINGNSHPFKMDSFFWITVCIKPIIHPLNENSTACST